MTYAVFDDRRCALGEGPLWHPTRKQLFWFDITEKKLLTRDAIGPSEWAFDECVSAAGWVDEDTLLMASATGLWRFSISDGTRHLITPLEHSNDLTRSNDGRTDPWGGFWIGTMGYNAEPGAGAIYRYYQGQLRTLFSDLSITNAICFAPDRSAAYFTDTADAKLMRVPLDRKGWPDGPPTVLIDFAPEGLNPDGAVTDANGTIWIAQWGAGRVAGYTPQGDFLKAYDIPASHTTCPAFGGPDMTTLYVTTAMQGLDTDTLERETGHGVTFEITGAAQGLPAPRVLL